jgi:chemotaxis protein histidine kinase CheA
MVMVTALGLGPLIVKKTLEGLSASISVKSEADQGSTFIVLLPINLSATAGLTEIREGVALQEESRTVH